MSKKHFIALADALRSVKPKLYDMETHRDPDSREAADFHTQSLAELRTWTQTVDAVADFCQRQNSAFNRERWIGYINGENGPNGGALDAIRDGEHKKQYHALPLIAYIHSGVALSLRRGGQFSDPWDSGQIGYVMVKKGQGFHNIRKAAESLVEEWNQYLSGDVWGYGITDADGNDVDSCWGFYGLDYCKTEARSAAEYARQHETQEAAKIDAAMHL